MKARSQIIVRLDIYILTAALTALLLLAGSTRAMPPHPDVQDGIEQGTVRQPFAGQSIHDPNGSYKINAPAANTASAVTGVFKALCLLVDFSDNLSRVNAYKFDSLIFADRFGTVHDYYGEVSYGQLDIVAVDLPSSIGWRRAPQTYAYYVDNNYGTESPYPNNSQGLCEDLVDLVDPAVDFSQYDNDGNGWMDVVIIVHAGRGAELTGKSTDMWSHKWSIPPRWRDGVAISDYTVVPEYWVTSGDMTIGVFCHELGHAFGLPDLYDTDGSSNGIGDWSLMSTGSWNGSLGSSPAHPDAWCKTRLGWIEPTAVTATMTNQAVADAETNATALKLMADGSGGNEYFLVENRQKLGYDASLPGSGLLIWHIDDEAYHNQYEFYPGYTAFGHYWVALEQADNLFQLEKKSSSGDAGDPFPGSSANTAFTPVSSPNSDAYNGSGGFVSVVNISASAPVMTADFIVSLASAEEQNENLPQMELSQNYPNPFNPRTSFSYTVESESCVEIHIYNTLGQRVRTLMSGRHLPGTYRAEWDGTDGSGHRLSSGVYLYKLTTGDDSLVRKMLLVK